jgi:hypothetical protein
LSARFGNAVDHHPPIAIDPDDPLYKELRDKLGKVFKNLAAPNSPM